MATVDEVKRVYAEGLAARVGAPNPYVGRIILAAVWFAGYRKMLDDMIANAPARRAYLRAQRRNPPEKGAAKHRTDNEE